MAANSPSALMAVSWFIDKRAWPCRSTTISLSREIGLIGLNNNYGYLGDATRDTATYKILEIPSNNPYYSKIIAWIHRSNFLPVRRESFTNRGLFRYSEF